MYYNIKIITKDSEFGLESHDRTIIEREMDIYFAKIFGASGEFVSKIKPVKINNSNLKSINDIDKNIEGKVENTAQNNIQYSNLNISQNTKKSEENISFNSKSLDEQIKKEFPLYSENNDLTAKIQQEKKLEEEKVYKELSNIFSQNQTSQTSNNENNISQDDNKLDINAEFGISESESKELEDEAKALYQELREQVALQKEQDNVSHSEIKSSEVLPEVKIEEPVYDILKDDVFENENNHEIQETKPSSELHDINKKEIPLNEKTDEVGGILFKDNKPNGEYQDIVNAYNEQAENMSEVISLNEDDADEYKAISLTEEITGQMLQAPIETSTEEASKIENPKQNPDDQSALLSFNKFLSGFMTDEIHDEFLVCCAYIKNVLNQDTFTIKYVNSKLFQTTGKIADTTIVDDLVKKEYIRIVSADEYNLYAIAQKGEEYLAGKLPN